MSQEGNSKERIYDTYDIKYFKWNCVSWIVQLFYKEYNVELFVGFFGSSTIYIGNKGDSKMIKLNNTIIKQDNFPDGTLLMKYTDPYFVNKYLLY